MMAPVALTPVLTTVAVTETAASATAMTAQPLLISNAITAKIFVKPGMNVFIKFSLV